MTSVTGEQVRNSILASGITWFPLRTCSVCNCIVGYEIYLSCPFWRGECECSSIWSPERRTWQDIANLINMQDSDASKIEIASKFGLKL